MKIAFISDPHVHNFPAFGGPHVSGINARCQAALVSLRQAVRLANEAACKAFVINGDLFDVDDPTPQVETAVLEALEQMNGDVHVLCGNHDQHSTSEGDHALGPLAGRKTHGGRIFVYDTPWLLQQDDVKLLLAPYRPEPVKDWLPDLLMEHRPHILSAHFGIIDEKTPPWLMDSHDAADSKDLFEWMERAGTRVTAVGNWHDFGTWVRKGRVIHQVGALTPTGFDNQGEEFGRVLIYDTDKRAEDYTVLSVQGPRFHKCTWGEDLDARFRKASDHLYLYMEAEPDELPAAREWLKTKGVELGVKGFKLMPSKASAVKKARAAAKAATLGSTLQESVSAFVKKMPLPSEVSRAAVGRRVDHYLKKAGGANVVGT